MEELIGPRYVVDFQVAIKERWVGEEGSSVMHCTTHYTTFSILEEPCWGCYSEFDRRVDDANLCD